MNYSFTVGNINFKVYLPKEFNLNTSNTLEFSHSSDAKYIGIDLHFHKVAQQPAIGDVVFVADSSEELFYRSVWRIHKKEEQIAFSITYSSHDKIDQIVFIPDIIQNKVNIYILPISKNSAIEIDPFLHPLGILLISSLQMFYGGLLIHASGIEDNGKGYIFTGISGIGKSTMAEIWAKNGAKIINDDRLMIYKEGHKYIFANTPMPYYNDASKQAPLNAIFLLNQSDVNYCNKIAGAEALSKVLANFMQQLFDEKLVEKHIEKTMDLIFQIPIFELGFKPDQDVVALVRALNL